MERAFKNDYPLHEEEFDLKRYFVLIFRKRWMLLPIFSIVMVSTLIHTFKQVPIYRATATILIERPSTSLSLSATRRVKLAPSLYGDDYYNTQYKILTNLTLAKRLRGALNLPFSAERLRGMIVVNPVRKTRLVDVSIDCEDPRMAREIANTLVRLYIEQNVENMLFMSKEILKAFPDTAKEIEQYTVYGQLKELSREESLESLPSIAYDPLLAELKRKKIDIESGLATLSKRYKHKHPKVATFNAQLKFIDNKINIQTGRILRSVQADLAGRLQANNIRVINYAEVPKKPIRPEKAKNILYGLFISTFFGISLILFTEYLDDTIKNQDDIEKKLGLPYLGYFPLIKKRRESLASGDFTGLDKDSDASNSIRNIKTNILFSAPEEELKTILVTSTMPQEGKSFLSAYIAFCFAQSGIKTLLLDADIRRPSVHKFLGIERVPGLTNLLVEKRNLVDVIRKSKYDNLYILPTGNKAPNPVELLSSQKMRSLLDGFSDMFEKIIIDATPGLLLPDASVLAKAADATLLVAKAGAVTKTGFANLKDKLSGADAKIIGVVLNFFQVEKHSHYQHKHYYSYYKNYYSGAK